MRTSGTLGRHGYSTPFTPSLTQSAFNRRPFMMKMLHPFDQDFCDAINGNVTVASRIARLFCWRGPVYIARFIMTVVIYTIQRVPWAGTKAHGSKEIFKRSKVEFNTSFAMSLIRSTRWTSTSPFGLLICLIFRTDRLISRMSMGQARLPQSLTAQASTRCSMAPSQFAALICASIATLTYTMPHGSLSRASASVANNTQATERLASQDSNQMFARRIGINSECHI